MDEVLTRPGAAAAGAGAPVDGTAEAGRAGRILERMGDGLVVVDGDFRVVAVNPAAERLLGSPRDRLLGRSHWEAFPGSVGAEPERQYRRVQAERVEAHFTHHYVDAGRDFHAEVDAYPTDEGGVAIFWRDVSARVAAEAALRESEARFRLMADALPQIVWITDADGRTEFFNRQWSAYTGRAYEPTTAADVAATAVHPDDASHTMACFEAARRTGATFQVEHRIRSAAGEYRWFLVRAEPQRDPESGRVVRWVGSSTDIHDRRRDEEALRASEARYRTLFTSIDDGFCVVEVLFAGAGADARPVDYRFLETNPAFVAQTGLADAVGRTIRELAPAHEAHWFDIYGRIATTGEPARFTERAAALGRTYDVYAFRVGAPAERRVAILFRDVSAAEAAEAERARLIAELQAERELLRALIRDVPAPVALQLGPEHRFALLSDAFRQVSAGRDLTGMTPQEAYPEVVGAGILERFDEVVATGRPWMSRETHARFDRRGQGIEDTWFDIRYQPVRDAAGRVIGVLNFSFDVTEQVRARRAVEALLADSERARRDAEVARAEEGRARGEAEAAAGRLRHLQAATAALAAATSFEELAGALRGTAAAVLGASAALLYRLGEARFGEDPDTLVAVLVADAGGFGADVPGRSRTVPLGEDAAVAETVRTGAPIFHATPEERGRRYPHLMAHSTSTRFGSWAMLPLLVEGRPVGSLALAWDGPQPGGGFTEGDRALATVLAAQCAVSLERVRLYAAERAARERAEAALAAAEAARTAAEAANRAKGEFLAVMSHELRTPLNAIGGYAELLDLGIRGPVTEAQRSDLARIQQSQRHLLGLINQVLNYTRVDAGAVRYDVADVPVAQALAAAEALVLPQARARGLTLVRGGCPPGLAARADGDKLQQILLNLLSNAVKFTEPGGEVRVTCADREGRVAMVVSDTGVGIAPEKLTSVFEPFVQVDQRLTRPHEGVGLGLAISRELARGMGGDLGVESTLGAGSTFTLTLPRA